MMFLPNDLYAGRSLDLYGEYSEGETVLFHEIVRPGMVIVEAGANIGGHTVCLSEAVGANGLVYAFEPQRVIFQMLCGNVALNRQRNVVARQAALGSKPGCLGVPPVDYTQENNFGGVSLGAEAFGEGVEVVTLDALRLPRCDFIKIDVEGMEEEVLQGAAATLAAHNPVLYVENDREGKSASLIAWLMEHGYRLYWHLPALFNPENYFSEQRNVFGNTVSVNMLCIPASSDAVMNNLHPIRSPHDTWW